MRNRLLLTTLALSGCTGLIGMSEYPPGDRGTDMTKKPGAGPTTPTANVPPAAGVASLLEPGLFGKSGLRRLSRAEYRTTIEDLTGVDVTADLALLPGDAASTYFDNDYTSQVASAALVEALKAIADHVGERVASDPVLRARVVPCTPIGPGDGACFRTFIRTFGRRVLRRPLADDLVERYATLQRFAVQDASFASGVQLVVRAMLQDLEFLYRVEIGTPVADAPGLFRLDGWELATRLSYLLWGSAPDDELLGRVDTKKLDAPADVRAAAVKMLGDPRAVARVARMHALWLAYDRLPHDPALATAMRTESDALIKRVVFTDKRPWTDLFSATNTFVDAGLAKHYGLPAPAGNAAAWVDYGSNGRRGILSHGSVLSNGLKFGDTSPVQRGIFLRNRLFCQDIPLPSASTVKVNVDQPPQGGDKNACKADRYAEHRMEVACAGCHRLMDPLGMGLENYDGLGRFRTVEPGKPECKIDGAGEVQGITGPNTFNGPGELGDLAIRSGALGPCFVSQMYQFALGRPVRDQDDGQVLKALAARFSADGRFRLDDLLLDLVSAPAFRHRVAE